MPTRAAHQSDPTFCKVYAIEATVHAPTFEGVYAEIKKVLKPGGIVRSKLCVVTSANCVYSSVFMSGA